MYGTTSDSREKNQLAVSNIQLEDDSQSGFSSLNQVDHTFQGGHQSLNVLKAQIEQLLEQNLALQAREQELKEANQRLQATNQELERFAYMASHDLKEPLRTVEGNLALIKRTMSDDCPPIWQEHLSHALAGTHRMQRLIEDLLEYSRTGQSTEKSALNPADLLLLVQSNLYQLIQAEKAVIKNIDLPAQIVGFKSSLIRLFQNIIANAIKFSRKGIPPVIAVSATEDEHYWIFSFSDNGIGIEPQDQERVFDLFSRMGTHEQRGFGIGLAICKKIVEAHYGRIWVESQPGQGSTFYVALAKNDLD